MKKRTRLVLAALVLIAVCILPLMIYALPQAYYGNNYITEKYIENVPKYTSATSFDGYTGNFTVGFFPADNPANRPVVSWRSCANLFYSNWLNYFVYQATPYDLSEIKELKRHKFR